MFDQPEPVPHQHAADVLARGGAEAHRVLVGMALGDDDRAFVERWCQRLAQEAADPGLRSTAALCLGHLARRFGVLTPESVALVVHLAAQPTVDGRARDALDDLTTFLPTDGVVLLREWRIEDGEWYVESAADTEIQRWTTESPTLTAEEVREAIAARRGGPFAFAVCEAATGELVGNIALQIADGIGHASYWIARQARGRGLATRALTVLIRWGFARTDISEVRLWAYAGNTASRRVAEAVGFTQVPSGDEKTVAYRLPRPLL